ncbi:hypothetical protein ncot_15755 [Nocardioides sp. JQ2195]|uniref:hypothetical protein n=1 Tax=Nocardioides sp. JQ2195 TaxID=2592334 RepID=UPI00143E929E|nr:hypothetical protein [Nocardioides sp. JQ2195]QIX27878.1 hypothetical protein ncot_15755 [Nocardioides sp. JQ2195]
MSQRFSVLLAALLVGLLSLAGCGDDDPDDPTQGKETGMDARSMKQQVDEAVLELGPRLVSALKGEVRAAGAQFTECPVSSSQWQYIANLGLVGPADEDAGELIAEQVRKAGFDEVTVTPAGSDGAGSVTATKGEVQVRVLLAGRGKPATVHNVEVFVDCTELDSDGEAFAEDDPGNDYADLR